MRSIKVFLISLILMLPFVLARFTRIPAATTRNWSTSTIPNNNQNALNAKSIIIQNENQVINNICRIELNQFLLEMNAKLDDFYQFEKAEYNKIFGILSNILKEIKNTKFEKANLINLDKNLTFLELKLLNEKNKSNEEVNNRYKLLKNQLKKLENVTKLFNDNNNNNSSLNDTNYKNIILNRTISVNNKTDDDLKKIDVTKLEFKYGKSEGDQIYDKPLPRFLTSLDTDVIGPINISSRFPFFQDNFISFYICPYGSVFFNLPSGRRRSDSYGILHGDNYIAGLKTFFWNTVYYREIKDVKDLRKIGNEIKPLLKLEEFSIPTWSYLITWTYQNNSNYQNSDSLSSPPENIFQVVLLSNGNYSFAVFNFNRINKNVFYSKTTTFTGYNKVYGPHFTLRGDSYYDSKLKTLQIVDQLIQNSNVDKPGRWIYRLDKKDEKLEAKLKIDYNDYITTLP